MLATSLMHNGKSAVYFYFFDKLEDCKNILRDEEETMNNIESEKTILPSDCFIPFPLCCSKAISSYKYENRRLL